MATLRQLRLGLGWTIAKLEQESGVGRKSITSAEKGNSVQADTAKALADALGRGYGKELHSWEIEGLIIR